MTYKDRLTNLTKENAGDESSRWTLYPSGIISSKGREFYQVIFLPLLKIKNLAGTNISLFAIDTDNNIKGKFRAKKNRVIKMEMLATINASYISKGLRIFEYKDSDDIRRKAMKYTKEDIHLFLYNYFMEKCLSSYNLFMEERTDKTDIDDLVILSNKVNVE